MIYLSTNPNKIMKVYNVSGVFGSDTRISNRAKRIDKLIIDKDGINKKYKDIIYGNRYLYRPKERELIPNDKNGTIPYTKDYHYTDMLGRKISNLQCASLEVNLTDFVAQFPFDPVEKISMLEVLYEKLDPDVFLKFLKENFISLYLYSHFVKEFSFQFTDTYDLEELKKFSEVIKDNQHLKELIDKFPTAHTNYRIHTLSKKIGKKFPIE